MTIYSDGDPITGASNAGVMKTASFDQYLTLSRKWYKIRSYLPWNANRKPNPSFRMIGLPFSLTLRDLAKYKRQKNITRSLCDTWTSCPSSAYIEISYAKPNFRFCYAFSSTGGGHHAKILGPNCGFRAMDNGDLGALTKLLGGPCTLIPDIAPPCFPVMYFHGSRMSVLCHLDAVRVVGILGIVLFHWYPSKGYTRSRKCYLQCATHW